MSNWRYIAQRATTGEVLELELPLRRDTLRWDLSGAGSLRGTVIPDTGALRAADGRLLLEEWGTLIYAEADGEIRWGGIVVSSAFNGAEWAVECAGFATYPHGIPYAGAYSRIGIDPLTAVRELWRHVQSYADGDLGVIVDKTSKTPVRLGEAGVAKTADDPEIPAKPYELNWWEAPDCGAEIDSLAQQTPFDYTERHRWDGDNITHEIVIGYPRLGRRRDDLAFIQGDNVVSVVAPTLSGEDFANEVLGLGAGEGEGSIHRTTAVRDGRLRRSFVFTAKDVSTDGRMDALIRDQLQRRQNTLEVKSVTVRDHPNAPIGSWDVGDDVLIEASIPWLGDVALWSRVVGWELVSEHTAVLSLARSDSFSYGG